MEQYSLKNIYCFSSSIFSNRLPAGNHGYISVVVESKKPEESDAKSISARPIEIIDSKSDKGADEDNVELRTIPNPLQS